MSYYRTQLEDWLKELDVEAETVYDIGGKQLPVSGRVKSWNVQRYEILDLPEVDIERTLPPSLDNAPKADLIFCLEVFEYLIHPVKALENIRWLLKDGGQAVITFMYVYPHHEELGRDSLRYTLTGIKRMAQEAGLELEALHYRRDASGLLQQFYRADGMKASKNFSPHDVTGFIVGLKR